MKGGRAGVVTDALLKVNSASVTLSVAARWIARRHLLVVGLLPGHRRRVRLRQIGHLARGAGPVAGPGEAGSVHAGLFLASFSKKFQYFVR